MAENASSPKSETSTKPEASVVPAAAAKPAAEAKPVETPVPPIEAKPEAKPVEAVKPAVEVKPAETPPAPEAAKVEEAKPVVATVPEKYEFVLEGDVRVNEAAIAAITPALKEAGLTQAAAQRLVSDYAKYEASLPAAKNAADLEVVRKDPELGLMNFGRTQNEVKLAVETFLTLAERNELSQMGMVNDPRLVRMFARVGRAMSDAGQTDSGPRPIEPKSITQRLYGGGDRRDAKAT